MRVNRERMAHLDMLPVLLRELGETLTAGEVDAGERDRALATLAGTLEMAEGEGLKDVLQSSQWVWDACAVLSAVLMEYPKHDEQKANHQYTTHSAALKICGSLVWYVQGWPLPENQEPRDRILPQIMVQASSNALLSWDTVGGKQNLEMQEHRWRIGGALMVLEAAMGKLVDDSWETLEMNRLLKMQLAIETAIEFIWKGLTAVSEPSYLLTDPLNIRALRVVWIHCLLAHPGGPPPDPSTLLQHLLRISHEHAHSSLDSLEVKPVCPWEIILPPMVLLCDAEEIYHEMVVIDIHSSLANYVMAYLRQKKTAHAARDCRAPSNVLAAQALCVLIRFLCVSPSTASSITQVFTALGIMT